MVALPSFELAQFPVTNAEWALFLAAGGYQDERWWTTAAARAWRRGEGTNEGARDSVRHWRRRFEAEPGLLEEFAAQGQLSPDLAEEWRRRMAMDSATFERHLATQFPDEPVEAPVYWHDERFNQPLQPVVGICWYEALAYCAWLAVQSGIPWRLPTEAEWEAAARGTAGRLFPWGNEFDRWRCNMTETHVRRTSPIGVFPGGDTPQGLADMAGNVYEWVSSAWGADPDRPAFAYPYDPGDGREDPESILGTYRILRGGAWFDGREAMYAFHRVVSHATNRHAYCGLRLAVSSG